MDSSRVGTGAESRAEGQAMNVWIREVPMRQMADELGISELPMRRENYDFYLAGLQLVGQLGFTGQDLVHATHEVLQKLFFTMRGNLGPIYNYVKWYSKRIQDGKKPQPFDEYFQWGFRQKAIDELTKSKRLKKKRGLSLDYESQEGGGINEDLLQDLKTPKAEDIVQAEEENEKRQLVFEEIPQLLLNSGNKGWQLEALWQEMRHHKTLSDLADALNAKGIPALGGGKWGTGSVHKVRNYIYGMVKRFLGKHGIDWESISSSRILVRG